MGDFQNKSKRIYCFYPHHETHQSDQLVLIEIRKSNITCLNHRRFDSFITHKVDIDAQNKRRRNYTIPTIDILTLI